jgi:SEL1 protein
MFQSLLIAITLLTITQLTSSHRISEELHVAASHRFGLSLINSNSFVHNNCLTHKLALQSQQYGHDLIQSSIMEAVQIYTELVERYNNSDALNALGEIHFFGEGSVEVNYTAAEHYFSHKHNYSAASKFYLSLLRSFNLTGKYSEQAALLYNHFAVHKHSHSINYPLAQLSMFNTAWRALYGHNTAQSCDLSLFYYKDIAETVIAQYNSEPIPFVIEKSRLSALESTKSPYNSEADKEILNYYRHKISQGDAESAVALASLHFFGAGGFPQDFNEAKRYFLAAARINNSPTALFYLAEIELYGLTEERQAKKASNYRLAAEYFTSAVKGGYLQGNTGLGYMNLYGLGREINYPAALRHFKLAAERANCPAAQFFLGIMNYNGLGTEKNYQSAYNLFNSAAQSGYTRALFYLAAMHELGQTGLVSCEIAVKLYKAVAERSVLSLWFSTAQKLWEQRQIKKALSYYAALAYMGHELAQFNLAYAATVLYEQTGQLPYKALISRLYKLSAEQGCVESNRLLGDYYYYIEPDYNISANYYKAAAQGHNSQAAFNLAYYYTKGLGMKQDYHLAKRSLDLSLQYDNAAYLPVNLALVALYIRQILDEPKLAWDWVSRWYHKPATPPANTNNKPINRSPATQSAHKPHDEEGGKRSSVASRRYNIPPSAADYDDEELLWQILYENLEDVIVLAVCLVVALFIYRRQRQIL